MHTDVIDCLATKSQIRALHDSLAAQRETWVARNRYYYDDDHSYMRFLVPQRLGVFGGQ